MMLRSLDADVALNHVSQNGNQRPTVSSVIDRIEKRCVDGDPTLSYYYFSANEPRYELPLFAAVHGIRRHAFQQAKLFAPLIDAIGGVLVAPLFRRKQFKGYQQLGRSGKGQRPDLAFQCMLSDIFKAEVRQFNQMVLFGYSGGGQFVHRYAMAYPRQVRRMAIAAPGWFTFPDVAARFPYGLARSARLPDVSFDAARFLKIPALVLVGQQDTDRDPSLNRDNRIDHRQGYNRLERARRWTEAMSAAASQFHYETPYHLSVLPHCGHSFVDCMGRGDMGRQVIRFLFEDERGAVSIAGSILNQALTSPDTSGGAI